MRPLQHRLPKNSPRLFAIVRTNRIRVGPVERSRHLQPQVNHHTARRVSIPSYTLSAQHVHLEVFLQVSPDSASRSIVTQPAQTLTGFLSFVFRNSYNKYTQIASRAVRQGLKESERVAAEKRAQIGLRVQTWENGVGGEQVSFGCSVDRWGEVIFSVNGDGRCSMLWRWDCTEEMVRAEKRRVETKLEQAPR